ncbi:polysaccharide biosynthesis/export family protein [Fontimonas sp. SYSU GA230001]|uniref:polysaccharide biosynthesis/export family protein n=1 Tax=Fontimonas sp. SYSU GA230001 TaxID=3142450 RepID=UPI0032B566FE
MTSSLRTLAGLVLAATTLCACFSPVPQPQARPLPDNPRAQPAATPKTVVPANPLDASVYRLDGGDVVRIDVLGEPELSLDALIDPSGFINYPFLGKVQASGLTVRQLEGKVRDGLRSGFLVNPDVRVALARYRPVYIGGQVRQPGAYPYALDLNVERALTLAGGLTAFASSSRIYIQRHWAGEQGRTRAELQSPVYPGDYIIVEERLF